MIDIQIENEKKKKRAERFGIVENEEKLAARKERFKNELENTDKTKEDDLIKKDFKSFRNKTTRRIRKNRFGGNQRRTGFSNRGSNLRRGGGGRMSSRGNNNKRRGFGRLRQRGGNRNN